MQADPDPTTADDGLAVSVRRGGDGGGGGDLTIVLTGELDLHGTPALTAVVHDVLEGQPSLVVVDAGGVTFMDSSGLKGLLDARRRATAAGAEFRLGASGAVRKVIVLAGLDNLLLPT